MRPLLFIDFESRSVADLRVVGLWNYAKDPTTEIWCMAYAMGTDEPSVWVPGYTLPSSIVQHIEQGGEVVAHNAEFELAIWNEIAVPRFGWPKLKPEQMICTLAACRAMGLPASLEDAALALGLRMLKDLEGRALMLRMARPRSKPGAPLMWQDEPDKITRLHEYCKQDVRVEREVQKRVMPLSEDERAVWVANYRINQRGIPLDVPTVVAAKKLTETVEQAINEQLARITYGRVESATALIAMKEWIAERIGKPIGGLAKQDVAALLEAQGLPDDVVQVLKLRQESGKASTAKFTAMLNLMGADGRVHNAYAYHAAVPGRFGGRGFQPHNLPRDMPGPLTIESIMSLTRAGDYRAMDMIHGPPLTVLSRSIRAMVKAPQGVVFCGGDWSNIEGRGVAWFCGEDWKLRVFRQADAGTGPGVYEVTAANTYGIPVEQVTKKQRQEGGKVPELAFGYGGGVGAFQSMSKNFGLKISNEQAEQFKLAWRAKHPLVVQTWRALSDAAISATRNEDQVFDAGYPGRHASYKKVGSFLWCRLPSGRVICYPYPKVMQGLYGPQLTYMVVPGADDAARGRIVANPANTPGWSRVGAHGGLLLENIVQGFCSDFLRDAILNSEDDTLPVVIHTHDDLYVEVPIARKQIALSNLTAIMNTPPVWAGDFPLKASVHATERYGL